jgi:transcription antitermination factor NusG
MEIESYLPLYLVESKWSDRTKILEKPLFPNYLFVRPADNLTYQLLNVHGVVRYVVFDGKAAAVPDQDIQQIRSLLSLQHDLLRPSRADPQRTAPTAPHTILRNLQNSVVKRLNATFLQIFQVA